MSLSSADARAMAVKMLNDSQLANLHRIEESRGYHMLPHEISTFSSRGVTIRKYWGIPEAPMAQSQHADRVGKDIGILLKRQKISVDLSDHEARCNFDWHILRSDIDFAYQGGSAARLEHDPFGAED